jgi:hypothetical protein
VPTVNSFSIQKNIKKCGQKYSFSFDLPQGKNLIVTKFDHIRYFFLLSPFKTINICIMKTLLPHTSCLIPLLTGIILLLTTVNASAQHLEVHAIKDFSTNETANKAWGAGGALEFDQWVKRTIFRLDVDWAMYRKRDDILNPNYQRISGGISAFYAFKLSPKATVHCGLAVNYTRLTHSHRAGHEAIDSLNSKYITLQHVGNFIGIGPHINLRYELTPRIKFVVNFVPAYLIPINYKVSDRISEPEYSKGVWLFPLQIGFSFQLYKPD